MTTMISGTRGLENLETNQQKRDVVDRILLLDPTAAPFVVLTRQIRKRSATNVKFEWYTDVRNPEWDAINNAGGYAAGDVSWVVDNGAYFTDGDLVKVPRTGEVVLVHGAPSSNTVTVLRHYGTTSAAAVNDDEPLLIIGNALEDGADAPTAKTTQVVNGYNYLQTFSRTVDITELVANSEIYGENDRTYQRRKKSIELAIELEKSFLFGERLVDAKDHDTSMSHYKYTTGGILNFISTYTKNFAGALSESDFDDYLMDYAFAKGSTTKYALMSPRMVSIISQWGKDKLITKPEDKKYGINIMTYLTAAGYELKIVLEKLLSGATYNGYGIIVDIESGDAAYRYLQGKDLKWKTDIQSPSAHKVTDELYGIIGFQPGNEATHSYFYGVTGAA